MTGVTQKSLFSQKLLIMYVFYEYADADARGATVPSSRPAAGVATPYDMQGTECSATLANRVVPRTSFMIDRGSYLHNHQQECGGSHVSGKVMRTRKGAYRMQPTVALGHCSSPSRKLT